MRVRLIAAMLLAGTASAVAAEAPQPPPIITVQGSCTATASPDRARVHVGAEATAPEAGRATSAAIEQYNRFKARVEKLALPDANLVSDGVQTERMTEDRAGKTVTTGYLARAGLTVESSSLSGMANVLQAAASEGMGDIGAMELYLSDRLRRSLEQSCLPNAAADAHERAIALLSGLGVRLGEVLSVTEGDIERPQPRPVFRAAAPMAMARMAPGPDLSGGTQSISVTVAVTFGIVSK